MQFGRIRFNHITTEDSCLADFVRGQDDANPASCLAEIDPSCPLPDKKKIGR